MSLDALLAEIAATEGLRFVELYHWGDNVTYTLPWAAKIEKSARGKVTALAHCSGYSAVKAVSLALTQIRDFPLTDTIDPAHLPCIIDSSSFIYNNPNPKINLREILARIQPAVKINRRSL